MHPRFLASAAFLFLGAGLLTFLRMDAEAMPVRAGTAVRMDTRELAERAGLVLEGRVLAAEPRVDARGRIETAYRVSVERTFWGEHEDERTLVLPGGVLPDGTGMLLAGMPNVRPGEELLLFLSEAGPTGLRLPVGLAQGKLRVVRLVTGGKLLLRESAGMSLLGADGAVLEPNGTTVVEYAEVLAEIEAGLALKQAGASEPGR